jgi:hypothetical protein
MMTLVAFLAALTVGAEPTPAHEVSGVLATRVKFEGEACDKIGAAVLDLLATCAHSSQASEDDWLEAQRRCHVLVKYPKPHQDVAVFGAAKIPAAEAIVTFTLASAGGIWVRSGDRYAYFSKFAPSGPAPGKELRRIQELLSEAKVAD